MALDHGNERGMIQRVFGERRSTMIDEARPYAVAELHATQARTRDQMRGLLETLPHAAFEPAVKEDEHGEAPWSAGQVIAHAVDAQINTFLRAARLAVGLGLGPDVPSHPDPALMPALSRADSLALLDIGDRDLAELRISPPTDAVSEVTREDEIMGTSGYKDMLLFLCLHDDDHLEQLKVLV